MQSRPVILLDVDIDGEVGIDISHLIFESLCHADDQVVDDRLDGAQGCDILARAVVDFDENFVFGREREADSEVGEIFYEFAWMFDALAFELGGSSFYEAAIIFHGARAGGGR